MSIFFLPNLFQYHDGIYYSITPDSHKTVLSGLKQLQLKAAEDSGKFNLLLI